MARIVDYEAQNILNKLGIDDHGAKINTLIADVYVANIYIEDDAVVDVLDLTAMRKGNEWRISIASTATVKKIIDGENEFDTYDEWVTFNKA